MKTFITGLMVIAIFSTVTNALAAPGQTGPYVSAFLGTSVARDSTVSGYDSFFATSFNDRASFDPGVYAGGTGGYNFGFMRVEGELAYRHARFDTITASSGSSYRSVDGDLGAFSTMFNVFFNVQNSSRVTPYLGGGVGFATLHLSETTGINNSGNRIVLFDSSDDTVFAAQVGGGFDISINRRFSLDLGYRYFITDKAKLNGDFTASDLRLESHNALAGFKFKF